MKKTKSVPVPVELFPVEYFKYDMHIILSGIGLGFFLFSTCAIVYIQSGSSDIGKLDLSTLGTFLITSLGYLGYVFNYLVEQKNKINVSLTNADDNGLKVILTTTTIVVGFLSLIFIPKISIVFILVFIIHSLYYGFSKTTTLVKSIFATSIDLMDVKNYKKHYVEKEALYTKQENNINQEVNFKQENISVNQSNSNNVHNNVHNNFNGTRGDTYFEENKNGIKTKSHTSSSNGTVMIDSASI